MPRQEIHVTFDPASTSGSPFQFAPERAVLNGETGALDVILHTLGEKGLKASFSEPEGIRWLANGPDDLVETASKGRTVLELRGFPMDEIQEEVDYGYVVIVDFEGETITSPEAQYPEVSCVPIGGGG